jgi:hypothetical protein
VRSRRKAEAVTRFFAPDQHTPGQLDQPWQLGDVFCFIHGPNPRNWYCFRVIAVEPDGSAARDQQFAELITDCCTVYATEIDAFIARGAPMKPHLNRTKT